MARTDIPVETVAPFALSSGNFADTAADATNDHEMDNDGKTLLYINNGGGSTCNVTIKRPAGRGSYNNAYDLTAVAVLTTETRVFGPFPPEVFNNSSGKVDIDIDFDTSVTFTAVSFSRLSPSKG